jgi:hypothetical protein
MMDWQGEGKLEVGREDWKVRGHTLRLATRSAVSNNVN